MNFTGRADGNRIYSQSYLRLGTIIPPHLVQISRKKRNASEIDSKIARIEREIEELHRRRETNLSLLLAAESALFETQTQLKEFPQEKEKEKEDCKPRDEGCNRILHERQVALANETIKIKEHQRTHLSSVDTDLAEKVDKLMKKSNKLMALKKEPKKEKKEKAAEEYSQKNTQFNPAPLIDAEIVYKQAYPPNQKVSQHYIVVQQDDSKLCDEARAVFSHLGASLGVTGIINAEGSKDDSLRDQLLEMKRQGSVSKILILRSFGKTGRIMRFKHIQYDRRVLENILDAMKSSSPSKQVEWGISSSGEQKCIYVLTEAVMACSITILLKYKDRSQIQRQAKQEHRGQSTILSGLLGARKLLFLPFTMGGTHVSRNTNQEGDDESNSSSTMFVDYEIEADGAHVPLDFEPHESSFYKSAPINPSLQKEEELLAERLYQAWTNNDEEEKKKLFIQYALQQEKMQGIIRTTVQSVIEEKKNHSLMLSEAGMQAFKGFTNQLINNPVVGVPDEYFYQILTQDMIERELGAVPTQTQPQQSREGNNTSTINEN